MHAITAPPTITPADRLGLTVFIAIAAHLMVVLGITFVREEHPFQRSPTLDVILVQRSSEKAPDDVDFLAQANQDGGGEHDVVERPTTPLPSPLTSVEPALVAAAPPQPAAPPTHVPEDPAPVKVEKKPPAEAPKPVLAQNKVTTPEKVVSPPKPAPKPKVEKARVPAPARQQPKQAEPEIPEPTPKTETRPTRTLSAAALVSRSLEMASLNAEINQRLKAYAERPKRKWITARTREHKYAAYMEAWRQKVERLGNLNYPDEARRRKLSGNLLLDVALNPDGSVNEINLRRSSGERVLDDAAIRIVKLGAPYAKFPKSIREEIDILHIERTWQFLAGDRFRSR
ncbi:MAG: TonB family protein [Gammaproteobacteria bacterium]|nr:TonB family protein [Gammaproteobacteria bacterium]